MYYIYYIIYIYIHIYIYTYIHPPNSHIDGGEGEPWPWGGWGGSRNLEHIYIYVCVHNIQYMYIYMCCVCSRIRETQQIQIRFQMQSDSAWQCRVACSRYGFAEAQNASAACSVTCLAASLDSERVGQRSSLFEFLGLCFSFFAYPPLSTLTHFGAVPSSMKNKPRSGMGCLI